ncbi:magnesium/cobalt transporter CorA [Mucilaginibacter calamicampi]|uniref:Magnesium transport protein CorA n=1 Tax=Mucilaginibacter calamicampi TaxID=1302352 RepID=A0ABW2YV70_9SPHI
MTSSIKKIQRKSRYRTVGLMPGTLNIDKSALTPKMEVFSYNKDGLTTTDAKDIDVVLQQVKKQRSLTHWIQISGIGDAKLLETLGASLDINPLVLEDIVNTHQRPKFDEYDDYVFMVSRVIYFNDEGELANEQFSALIKGNILITFQETYVECFPAVKTRLSAGKGLIRTAGPAYMAYALTDTILDLYFVVLAQIGESLDELEDKLYDSPDKSVMYNAQQLKRSLINVRRAVWPERDKINDILRTDNRLISKDVKMYLRDAYDHCVQIMDLIENDKEITSSIIDLYLSMVSNRMNEIMKVLTIISAIFIPLTFIAGIYGMNFAKIDPVTNKVMPDNMPELYSEHGYYYAVAAMLFIAVIQIIIFWRKGWFSKL